MALYLSGRYWWLGITAIVLFTLLVFHALSEKPVSREPQAKPQQVKQTTIPTPKLQTPVPTHPVLDLFNPTNAAITRDQAISRTRGELEQLLVISILLNECQQITDAEKSNITITAKKYATRSNLFADSDATITELSNSAQKTYALVYAKTRCNEPSLKQLKSQTLAWQSRFMSQ
ncbi:MAG: hypothetical protein ACOYJ2_00670 [Rickettsiales bacterium]